MIDDSEEDLIRRSRCGDTEAFGVLVKRYAGRATAAAALLVGNYPDALDLSQEAFVRAWRHLRTFKGKSTFFAWYSTILRNVCRTWLRRHHRSNIVQLTEAQTIPAPDADPALLAEHNEQRDRLCRAILRLSTPHREIIVLSHFQQLSYKEIARVLEIPIGTVMSRLHAARGALRSSLLPNQT